MGYKSILSVVGIEGLGRDVAIAADLCREVGAHLSVFVMALATSALMTDAAFDPYAWAQQHQPDADRLQDCVRSLSRFLAETGISAEVLSGYPDSAWADEVVGARARYVDLVVLGPGLGRDGDLKSKVIQGALWSGKPLLIIPRGAKPTLKPSRVLVAWDESQEASRALREALDLMAGAEVHVAMVNPTVGTGHAEPGVDIAAFLMRHDAKVSVDILSSEGRTVPDALRKRATDISADLLVMGAYGHSRARERIFGGVTKSMLANPPLPLWMAR